MNTHERAQLGLQAQRAPSPWVRRLGCWPQKRTGTASERTATERQHGGHDPEHARASGHAAQLACAGWRSLLAGRPRPNCSARHRCSRLQLRRRAGPCGLQQPDACVRERFFAARFRRVLSPRGPSFASRLRDIQRTRQQNASAIPRDLRAQLMELQWSSAGCTDRC